MSHKATDPSTRRRYDIKCFSCGDVKRLSIHPLDAENPIITGCKVCDLVRVHAVVSGDPSHAKPYAAAVRRGDFIADPVSRRDG